MNTKLMRKLLAAVCLSCVLSLGAAGVSFAAPAEATATGETAQAVAQGTFAATATTTEVALGDTGKLVCSVEDAPAGSTIAYQWQWRTSASAAWQNATATGNKTATLSATVTAARANYQYRCVVTASNGDIAATDPISFKVQTSALVATATTDPVSAIGQTGSLICSLEGLDGMTATYQWEYSSNGGSTWQNATATGAKTAVMSAAVTQARLKYLYRCVVASAGRTAVSNEIAFKLDADELVATASTTPVSIGMTGTLSCAVEGLGSATATYQWQYSATGGQSWGNSSGDSAKTAAFSATVTATRAGYLYRCVVTASDGRKATTDAIKFDTSGAALSATASTTPVATGANGTLSCAVTGQGSATVSYQWQCSNNQGSTWFNATATGAQTANMTAAVNALRLSNLYRCKVTASDGRTALTDPITFQVTNEITIDKTTASMKPGYYQTVKITSTLPDGVSILSWTSSDEEIATATVTTSMQECRITGVKPGTCTVTALASNGETVSCAVTVRGAVLSTSETSVTQGDSVTISATTLPAGDSITWSSSDESIATITVSSDGSACTATGVASGVAYIYATTAEGVRSGCKLTVSYLPSGETTAYYRFETGKLYAEPDLECTDIVKIHYMTPVTIKSFTAVSGGRWYTVVYNGEIRYVHEYNTESVFSLTNHDAEYVGTTTYQNAVLETALSVYNRDGGTHYDYTHADVVPVESEDGSWGFDCSSFAAYVLKTAMRQFVPTYNVSQEVVTLSETTGIYNQTDDSKELVAQTIATKSDGLTKDEILAKLEPGDLIFLYGLGSVDTSVCNHAAIYIGGGDFINSTAYNSSDEVDITEGTNDWLSGVVICPFNDYYYSRFLSAKRVLPASEEEVAAQQINEDRVLFNKNLATTKLYAEMNYNSEVVAELPAGAEVKVIYTGVYANQTWAYVESSYGNGCMWLSRAVTDGLSLTVGKQDQVTSDSTVAVKTLTSYKTVYAVPLYSDAEITWTTDNASVVKLQPSDDGLTCNLRAVANGTCKVTCTATFADGSTSAITFTAAMGTGESEGMTISESEHVIGANILGYYFDLSVGLAKSGTVTWSTNGSNVVSLEPTETGTQCKITSTAYGACNVTATVAYDDGTSESVSCKVTVDNGSGDYTYSTMGAALLKSFVIKNTGGYNKTLALGVPETAKVVWSTSDETIAKVVPSDDGLTCTVKSGKAGTCTITATIAYSDGTIETLTSTGTIGTSA